MTLAYNRRKKAIRRGQWSAGKKSVREREAAAAFKAAQERLEAQANLTYTGKTS